MFEERKVEHVTLPAVDETAMTTSSGLILVETMKVLVGVEGTKFRATAISLDGAEELKFVKVMFDAEEGIEQSVRFSNLRKMGINTPRKVELHELDDGAPALVVTDLSEGGRKLVLSANNPELYTDEVRSSISAIPNEVKASINEKLVTWACRAAEGVEGTKYLLAPNVFALVIDPNDPLGADVYAIDVGVDLTEGSGVRDLRYLNVLSVGRFFAMVLGQDLSLSGEDPRLSSLDIVALGADNVETRKAFWPESR